MHVSVEVLAASVGWVLTGWQTLRFNMRVPRSLYSFTTLLFVSLASTLQVPEIARTIDSLFRAPDLGRILQYVCAIAAATAWGLISSNFMPVARRRWILALGPIVVAVALLIWYEAAAHGQTVREEAARTNYAIALSVAVHLYLFVLEAGLAMPNLINSLRYEPDLSLRLRLADLFVTHTLITLWMLSSLGYFALIVVGRLPPDVAFPLVPVFMLLVTIFYGLSFLPARVYRRLALSVRYLLAWRSYSKLRRLERDSARLLMVPQVSVSWQDVLRSPDYALYVLVIAVLDRRKALQASHDAAAIRLACALQSVNKEDLDYAGVVQQLQTLARRLS